MSHGGRRFHQMLREAAPDLRGPLLHTLALLLASPASSDALLCAADALSEAAAYYRTFALHVPISGQLQRTAEIFRAEAPKRAQEPTHV